MALDLDLNAITAYLSEAVEGFAGPVEVKKFETGQSNPTFLLSTPSRKYVLRRKPPGVLLKSAHAVDREFKVQSALYGSDVPVARMYHLCEDESVIGSVFYLMEFLDGRTFVDPSLPDLEPSRRGDIFDEMNRVLAGLHDVDIEAVGLSNFGPQGNYYERQISRWTKQYYATETEKIPDMDALIEVITSNIPADDGQRTLVHGDYRIDNMIFAKDGPSCLAVLDWELSTIGHPYADLAALIMQWQMPPGTASRGLAGVDRALSGLPSDDEFIERYCQRRNLPAIDNFGFYLAFCFFRMAAILQGVKKRALDGNASNPEHGLEMGKHIPSFASEGLRAFAR